MTSKVSTIDSRSLHWLKNSVFPLWFSKGVDWAGGGFHENLSIESGEVQVGPKRAMVQARQIYSFRIGKELKVIAADDADKAIRHGVQFLMQNYAQRNGSFAHSVDQKGQILDPTPDLYGQAFVLFGLANAFLVERNGILGADIKARALKLVDYLCRERSVNGGFTEIKSNEPTFESNPHMHLFESAISWAEIDGDSVWLDLAAQIFKLCETKFIDAKTGILAEKFNRDWSIQKTAGKFMFEPGHQFEWAWLLGRYEKLLKSDLSAIRMKLVDISEAHGISASRKMAYDEMWSDLTVKTGTSRFWPQTERVKAVVQVYLKNGQDKDLGAATEAMEALNLFFQTQIAGMWFDRCQENGEFLPHPVKGSSLYHIIGAIAEYHLLLEPNGKASDK